MYLRGKPIMAATVGALNCHGNREGYHKRDKVLNKNVLFENGGKVYGKPSTTVASVEGSLERRRNSSACSGNGHSANFYESKIY